MTELPTLFETQWRLNERTSAHLPPPEEVWEVRCWGWVSTRLDRKTLEDYLAADERSLSSGHAAVDAALQLAALRGKPPPVEVLFYAAKQLGAARRKSKSTLAALCEARDDLITRWPPPVPTVPVEASCVLIAHALANMSGAEPGSEYWYCPAPGALPVPFEHPSVRETLVAVAQAADAWAPSTTQQLSKHVLSARSRLEGYRLSTPFKYGRGSGRCPHTWMKILNLWAEVREWLCLECLGRFLCCCEVRLYHGMPNYSNKALPALEELCPHCRGEPDLMPPSPNQLMYHSTMFDVVHLREVRRLEQVAVRERMEEQDEDRLTAMQVLRGERGDYWARELIRLAHDFEIHERWVSETAMVQAIREAFPDELVVREASPEWLGAQRLDAFLPQLGIAFEYHGQQHFEPVEFFGGQEAFERRKRLDQRKRDLCEAQGVQLIVFVEPEHVGPEEIQRRVVNLPANHVIGKIE